ncbi:unnamed protein product [Polarella glacialis]|uniref:Uncharacterized protein n=1 Tax=Polarella glacialis TaxID=89957 RepID=A0A813F5R2_POLGL|nr:unnamed protein product [Polarella glacialis]
MNSRSNARAGTSQPGRLAARRRKPHFFALLVASVVVVAVILSLGGSQAFFLIPSVVPARTTALAGLARAAEGDSAASKPGTRGLPLPQVYARARRGAYISAFRCP